MPIISKNLTKLNKRIQSINWEALATFKYSPQRLNPKILLLAWKTLLLYQDQLLFQPLQSL